MFSEKLVALLFAVVISGAALTPSSSEASGLGHHLRP